MSENDNATKLKAVPDVLLHEYKERCADLRMRLQQYGLVWSLILPILSALTKTYIDSSDQFWKLIESDIFLVALTIWYSLLLNLNLIIENLNHHLFVLSHEMNRKSGETHHTWFVELRPGATGAYNKQSLGFWLNQVPYYALLIPAATLLGVVTMRSIGAVLEKYDTTGNTWIGFVIAAILLYVILTYGLIRVIKYRNLRSKRELIKQSEEGMYSFWRKF